MERLARLAGWAGVVLGLSGVLPGIFLLRGSMIEFGMLLLLLGVGVLFQVALLEELKSVRRSLARLTLRAERADHEEPGPQGGKVVETWRNPDSVDAVALGAGLRQDSR